MDEQQAYDEDDLHTHVAANNSMEEDISEM